MNAIRYCGCPKCEAVFKLPAELADRLADERHNQLVDTVRCGVCHAVFDVDTHLMQKTDGGFVATRPDQQRDEKVAYSFANRHRNDNNHGSSTERPDSARQPAENTLKEISIDGEENPFADHAPCSLDVHTKFEYADVVHAESLYTSASLSKKSLPETANGGTEYKAAHYITDRNNPLMTFIWFIVAVGFVLLLGAQVNYFLVPQYAQDTTYRQYLTYFCRLAGCQLPPRQDPFQFTLTHTRIDLHPTEPEALRVTVKTVNQAEFAQPYPHLQLTLMDRVGRVVGRRIFSPNLYLPKEADNMIGQGQFTSIVLDLAHPHEKAVGFIVDIVSAPASS